MNIDCTLIPPSPVSCKVPLEIRACLRNNRGGKLSISILNGNKEELLYSGQGGAVNESWNEIRFKINSREWIGDNTVIFQLLGSSGNIREEKKHTVKIIDSASRSGNIIGGAWCGLYHWSETEGRLWNPVIKQFKDEDWSQLVCDMHDIGMNVIVVQELFRNEEYFEKHTIPGKGYHGKAFYPSRLYEGRMEIRCIDPLEIILSTADKLGMNVLPGIGMYAWFDFTRESLEWHKKVAEEVWNMYGHHESFYGWYISEEVFGELKYGENTEENIVNFFAEFKKWKNTLSPARPVMLAPNCFYVHRTEPGWRRLAGELDIICPFAFHRMLPDDNRPEQTITLLQDIVDKTGAHLWMDMESFLFNEDKSLYPRPVGDMIAELAKFPDFEKVLCYQYPGLMNSPQAELKPGGDRTVDNYVKYKDHYLRSIRS